MCASKNATKTEQKHAVLMLMWKIALLDGTESIVKAQHAFVFCVPFVVFFL